MVQDAGPNAAGILFGQLKHRAENPHPRECSNVDEYAEIQSKLLPKIERLASLPGGNILAFDCMALMSENLWGDMDRKDASGYGDTEEPYLRMDQTMLKYAEQSFADGEWAPEVTSEYLED